MGAADLLEFFSYIFAVMFFCDRVSSLGHFRLKKTISTLCCVGVEFNFTVPAQNQRGTSQILQFPRFKKPYFHFSFLLEVKVTVKAMF